MLDSGCTKKTCALSGLPGPMRHWVAGFTHSVTHFLDLHGILVILLRKPRRARKKNSATHALRRVGLCSGTL